jgi:hypothetical protein
MSDVRNRPADKYAQATASNAVATATLADPGAGQTRYYITHLSGGFDSATPTAGTITLDLGVTALVFTLGAGNQFSADFSHPLPADSSTAVTAAISDGGSGITGRVVVAGYAR